MSELQGILDCLSQEASLDSSGRFTLDFQRAAEPLGVFLRDHPAWPWLRAIQLAHQQLADSIQITISRDQVKLRYQAQRWAQDWGCVGRWLQGAEIRPPRTAVADVVLGMSASGALEWKVLLGQQPVLSWKNQAALWVADQTEENFVVEIQARFQAPGWFGFRKNPLSGIHADILQRCGLSPVTILIDGFTVNDPHWRGLPGISATTSADGDYQVAGESLHWPSANLPRQQRMATNPPQLLSPACTLLPQHAAILAPSAYLKQTICLALDFPNQTILTPWEPGDPVPASPQLALYATGPNSHQQMLVGAWEDCSWGVVHRFILPLESEGPGQLLLVRDGIVSNPSPRPDWPPGLIGITCDSRLSTDASALIIVNDDAMQVVASEMLQRAGPMLKQIRSMLDPIHPLLEGHLTFHQALRLTNRLDHLINP